MFGQATRPFEVPGRMGARKDRQGVRATVFRSVFRKLHSDPRWSEWRASIGMPEDVLAAVTFDPKLPE